MRHQGPRAVQEAGKLDSVQSKLLPARALAPDRFPTVQKRRTRKKGVLQQNLVSEKRRLNVISHVRVTV